jgi:carboxylesterase type B
MAFIHGGAFVLGASRAGSLDGRRLAARGPVVVVSFNYRLGALGFLAGVESLEGNYGLRDQQLALAWVRDNVRAFHGDPARVTLFGESAGAMSTGLHLISPPSHGLFRAAILESNPYGLPYKRPREAERLGTLLRDLLGCLLGGLDCMRRASVQAIVEHQFSATLTLSGLLEGLSGELVWAPVVDGHLIPRQPNSAGAPVPIIIGTNRDEGEAFLGGFRIKLPFAPREIPRLEYEALLHVLFPSPIVDRIATHPRYAPGSGDNTESLARLLTDYVFSCASRHVMNGARHAVFAYQFAHVPSFDVWPGVPLCAPGTGRVCHSFELPFVFGNPVNVLVATAPPDPSRRFSPPDQTVADALTAYWTHFARTLDPNHAGAPPWPRYRPDNPVRLVIDSTMAPSRDFSENCTFWDSVGYDEKGLFEHRFFLRWFSAFCDEVSSTVSRRLRVERGEVPIP